MSIEVMAATAAAATPEFKIGYDRLKSTLVLVGMQAGDSVPIEVSNDEGATFEQLYEDGVAVVAAYQSRNVIGFNSAGYFRINKGVTTGNISASLSTISNL